MPILCIRVESWCDTRRERGVAGYCSSARCRFASYVTVRRFAPRRDSSRGLFSWQRVAQDHIAGHPSRLVRTAHIRCLPRVFFHRNFLGLRWRGGPVPLHHVRLGLSGQFCRSSCQISAFRQRLRGSPPLRPRKSYGVAKLSEEVVLQSSASISGGRLRSASAYLRSCASILLPTAPRGNRR